MITRKTEHEQKAIEYYEKFAESEDIEDLNLSLIELSEAKKTVTEASQYVKNKLNNVAWKNFQKKLQDIERYIKIVTEVRNCWVEGYI